MSDALSTAQRSAETVETTIKFRDMKILQQLAYVGKSIIFLVSFGFAFPNIFSDD